MSDELARIRALEHASRRAFKTWSGALGGRSGAVAPFVPRRTRGRPQPTIIVNPSAGETVTLTASVSIPAGGAEVAWDTILSRLGFEDLTVPATQVAAGRHGYYDLAEVELAWTDGWRRWSTVSVRVAGSPWRTWTDQRGPQTLPFTVPLSVLEAGDSWTLLVDHGDTGPHTLEARATFQLVDRLLDVADPDATQTDPDVTFAYGDPAVTALIPSGTQPGDLLIAHVHSTEPSNTVPTGWTRAATAAEGGAWPSDQRGLVDYRIAQAGDAGSEVTWTGSGGTQRTDLAVTIHRIAGIDTASPFTGSIDKEASQSASTLTLSTSTDAASTLLLLASTNNTAAGGSPALVTLDASFAETYNVEAGDNRYRMAAGLKSHAAAAPTGDVTVTYSTAENQLVHAFLVPLRPL